MQRTGSLVTFEDGAELNLRNVSANITGSGLTAATIVQCKKNLLYCADYAITTNAFIKTFVDGIFTMTGNYSTGATTTVPANNALCAIVFPTAIPAGAYTVSLQYFSTKQFTKPKLNFTGTSGTTYALNNGDTVTFTETVHLTSISCTSTFFSQGAEVVCGVQIEASTTQTAFEVFDGSVNTVTFPSGVTADAGTLDATNGVLTITAGSTGTYNVTPVVLSFTSGLNHFFADTGDITITYALPIAEGDPMIKVFGAGDTTFTTNGDYVLKPVKAKVRKEDNGAYYLDVEAGLEAVDYIIAGKILVVKTPQGEQAFRITNPQKTKTKVAARAYHIFYDAENYMIADSYVVDKTCNGALEHLNSATDTTSPFTTISDIETVNSYRCVRKSLYEAIQTVLERWGGHLTRDNWQIGVRATIGQDNGVTVRYAKNLKDITSEEKWDDVVTKLLPVGKDGILLNETDPTASIYVTATQQYDIPYTKTVSFSQDDVVEEDFATEAAYKQALVDDLRLQATAYVEAHALPLVNYTLKANLEKITDVGDTVEVIDERLGINLLTNVIAFEYDCILHKYTEVEFGNFKEKLAGLLDTITAQTEKLVTEATETVSVTLGQELEDATDSIRNILGNSYVIYDGDKILIVDALPKETATNVIMINNAGIGFSQTGINGTFNSAWTINGTMNMQNINVINLVADLIKGGTLKLGANQNASGVLELYDTANNLVGLMNKDGLKMYGQDGSYVLMNNTVGFAGYDRNDNKIYWASADEFHMQRAFAEQEISVCGILRFIPVTITENNVVTHDGIALVGGGT